MTSLGNLFWFLITLRLFYVCICILGMCTVLVLLVWFSFECCICVCAFVFVRLGLVCREFGVFGRTGVV